MRYWDNKEVAGRGTKYCLVIDPEDGTNPIRTYGWTETEVLDKVAKTAEAAQQLINRQRSQQQSAPVHPGAVAPPAAPARRPLSADDLMQATADLQNPAKSTEAVKTLLRGAGIDVDRMKLQEDAQRVSAIAQEWERSHADFLASDERNQRMLMDKAALMAGGMPNITAETLDAAYSELQRFGMFFDAAPVPTTPTTNPHDAPDGNSGTRTERPSSATSYRRTALASPGTGAPRTQPLYTRAQIDQMTSAQLREKIEREPGFQQWFDKEFSAPTAR